MLHNGANAYLTDRYGCGALHRAAMSGQPEVVSFLLGMGLSPNQADTSEKNTPLHEAAICGHSSVIRSLLQAGANRERVNNNGRMAWQLAAEEAHLEAAVLLRPGIMGKIVHGLYASGIKPAKNLCRLILKVRTTPFSELAEDDSPERAKLVQLLRTYSANPDKK